MPARLIDGRQAAARIRQGIQQDLAMRKGSATHPYRPPKLAMVLVGDNPASKVYVGAKERACGSVGLDSVSIVRPASTGQQELHDIIHQLNADLTVDGILVQLPLPPHLDRLAAIAEIDPRKDVDGLTPTNQGLLAWGVAALRPCTPLGVMRLLEYAAVPTGGALAAVLGRSILVGAPMAELLSHAGATVISLHSQSRNVADLTRQADIVVVATGRHHLVRADWIKPGATVIDVGIHRIGGRIEGDVAFDEVASVAGAVTPVPGGVGPMTIAMLLANCLTAHDSRKSMEGHRSP